MRGVTHIAGLSVIVSDRYQRQRCAWCDAVLIDEDLTLVAVPEGQEGGPTAWPQSRLVHNDGGVWWVLPEGAALPADFCGAAVHLDPSDFTEASDAG